MLLAAVCGILIAPASAAVKVMVFVMQLVYVIADPEHVKLLPDGTVRILVTADLETIKDRFTAGMHGTLPGPVALAVIFIL